jgi:signal transduction histidine kinase/ActR/RegA family two-component response regulator
LHPENRRPLVEKVRQGITVRNQETEFRHKSGEIRTALVSMEPLRTGDAEPMLLVIVVDVTEQRALQVHLQRLQRVESVGLLASGIAHDMNNILAPVMMAAPLLRMDIPEGDKERLVSTIEVSARRGAALVRQLLIFGRGVEGVRRPVMVADVVREIAAIAQQTFSRAITLEQRVPPDVWPIDGDASQLHQIVLNLCVNARDAMRDGGVLTLAAENVELDAAYAAQHRDAQAGRYVVIRVADTGTGIPPELVDRIFDPFFTTKPAGEGTGLGLSTVLGIVKSHGGFLRLHSEPGRGSTFEIYLRASPHDAAGAGNEPALPQGGAGELILVVDDEEEIRAVLRETLVRHNYKVMTAADGVEATAIFAANAETIRLVITDLDMPIMDGANLTRVLRRMNPDVSVIISTGGRGGEMGGGAKLAGLNLSGVLPKPFTLGQILQAIQTALAAVRTPAAGERAAGPDGARAPSGPSRS